MKLKKLLVRLLASVLGFCFITGMMVGCESVNRAQDSSKQSSTGENSASPSPAATDTTQDQTQTVSNSMDGEKTDTEKGNYIELFADPDFEKGFALSPIKDSQPYNPSDMIDFGQGDGNPAWKMAQWFSNFALQGVKPVQKENTIEYVNTGKRVALKKVEGKRPELTLEMFGGREYEKNGPRKDGQAWPHLLIEQTVGDKPLITDMNKLMLSFNGKIDKCENLMGDSFNPNLHSAHVNFYFIIQNQNSDSPAYGDFFWFGIPFYDFRYDFFPEYLAADGGKEGASKKMIYTVSGAEVYKEKHEVGKNYKAEIDLLPYIKQGLEKGNLRGFLEDTKLEDLRVTAFNVGWELFGTFDVSFTISDLSLKAYYKDNRVLMKDESFNETFDKGTEWEFLSGSWGVKDGVLSDHDGQFWINRAVLKNRKYSDFTLDFKVRHDEDTAKDGWCGFAFRKAGITDTHEDSGYMLFIKRDGTAQIYNKGKTSAAGKLADFKVGEFYPVRLIAKGDTLQVFGKDLEKPVIEYKDSAYSEGFVALVTGMARASFDDIKITAGE